MSNLKVVEEKDFEKEVLQNKEPVLVDFSASWCMPCRVMEPVVEKLAIEVLGKCKVVKLDIDDAPNVAKTYGVRSIPAFLVFKDGKVVATQVGSTSKENLAKLIPSE